MDELIRLALMFVTESHGRQRPSLDATRMTTGVLCTGCAMVSVIAGVACGVAALWIYLSPIIGSAGAALAAAGIFLVMSGSLMFVARFMFRPEPGAIASTQEAEPVVEEIVGLLREGFERHKGASLLAALVAGIAAGSSNKV